MCRYVYHEWTQHWDNRFKLLELFNRFFHQAKKFVESAPQVVKEKLSKEDAEKLKAQLESVGASVEIEWYPMPHNELTKHL